MLQAPVPFTMEQNLKSVIADFNKSLPIDEKLNIEAYDDNQHIKVNKSLKMIPKEAPAGKILTKEDYRPTDQELIQIQSKALITGDKDRYYVFIMEAFNTDVDRAYEHFLVPPAPVFAQAKALFPDKTWVRDHTWKTSHEVGRILDAWVAGTGDNLKLMLKVYINDIPDNSAFLDRVFDGIHSGVSVGFLTPLYGYLCDSCNKALIKAKSTDYSKFISIFNRNVCDHKPGTPDRDGDITTVSLFNMKDAFEITSTPVPAQRPAHILGKGMKSMSTNKTFNNLEEVQIAVKGTEVVNPNEQLPDLSSKGRTQQEPPDNSVDQPAFDPKLEKLKDEGKEKSVVPEQTTSSKATNPSAEDLNSKATVTIDSETNIKNNSSEDNSLVSTQNDNKPAEANAKDLSPVPVETGSAGSSPGGMTTEQSVQLPVEDKPEAVPTNDGGASSADQSPYDVHALKGLVDTMCTNFKSFSDGLKQSHEELKSAMKDHIDAIKAHAASMKTVEPSATEVNPEAMAQKSLDHADQLEKLLNFAETMQKNQKSFLEAQFPKRKSNKTKVEQWSESMLAELKTLEGDKQ